jgi:hypothetical protein
MLLLGAAVTAGVVVAAVTAQPARADAQGVGGVQPSNYRTSVDPGSPGIPGVTARVLDLGGRIELTNRSQGEVTVVGYENEPYLRIGPSGVFENTKSPATTINRTATPQPPPASADPTAPPEWRKVSDQPVARWHDHRAHWTASEPAIVRAHPNTRHVLERWTIPLAVAGQAAAPITGTVTWVPPVSPWPWLIGAAVVAIGLALATRTRAWRAVWIGALGVIAVGEAVALIGAWWFSTAGLSSRALAGIYNFVGCVIAIAALTTVLRRSRQEAAPIVLIAGLIVFLGTGLPGFDDLSRSQLPTDIPVLLARLIVAGALGLGFGLVIAAAQYLRLAPTSPASQGGAQGGEVGAHE